MIATGNPNLYDWILPPKSFGYLGGSVAWLGLVVLESSSRSLGVSGPGTTGSLDFEVRLNLVS